MSENPTTITIGEAELRHVAIRTDRYAFEWSRTPVDGQPDHIVWQDIAEVDRGSGTVCGNDE